MYMTEAEQPQPPQQLHGSYQPHRGTSTSSGGGNEMLRHKTESVQSLSKAMAGLSPVFQSEAARQIITEMAAGNGSGLEEHGDGTGRAQATLINKSKRAQGRSDKRRYMTAPSNTMNAKSMQNIQTENDMNKNVWEWR